MKFGDKLVALRKKNGLSQEELAAKLNVSRQSVSKWEGNTTYPETDKIIQICNIFDCSMDDLINDNITDLSNIERKNKTNFNIVFDSLLEFITKTINMFSDMKFISGLKCLVEMFIIALVLGIFGIIITGLLTNIIYNLFSFLPEEAMYIVTNIIAGLFEIAWLIIALIILVHIFKIRYLDYYDNLVDKEKNKIIEKKDNKDNKEEKANIKNKPQIIIRDSDHEPFAFLSVLSKIIICFVKFIVGFIGLGFIITLIAFIVCLVICIPFSKYSLIFIGADISLIGTIIINIIIILLIIHFILNKKKNTKFMLIISIISIVLIGVGIGISFISLKDIEIKDSPSTNKNLSVHEEKLNYEDNMIITTDYNYDYEYIIDNNIANNNIIIKSEFNDKLNKLNIHKLHTYEMNDYNLYFTTRMNFKEIYKIITSDLQNNTLRDYSYLYVRNVKITASQTTIDNLITNLSKVYIFDKQKTDNGYKISNIEDKINSINDECGAVYDATTDTLVSPSSSCSCQKENIQTSRGTTIEYYCIFNDNYNE